MGRPGGGGVHRRTRDRRHARSQRPAPRPLDRASAYARRLGGARLRDRGDGRAARERPAQGPPPARQALPRRPRRAADRRRRGGQARRRHPEALRRLVSRGRRPPRRPAAAAAARPARPPSRCARVSWRSATRWRTCASCSRRPPPCRRGADRVDGQRPGARGALRPPAAAVLLLQAALRPGHQPADRPHPRERGHERGHRRRLGAQPLRRVRRARAPARDGDADPAQRRARAAAPGRLLDLPGLHGRHHVARGGGPGGHGGRARARLPRGRGGASRTASTSSSSPTARSAPSGSRSRRCWPSRPSPPPRARGHAPAGRPRARVRRAARGPPLRDADRLRRLGREPLPMFESLAELVAAGKVPGVTDLAQADSNVIKGIGKGLLKTISKMGISTIQSYCGAQIFEAVGLAPELIDRHFAGTASRIGGIGADVLARETLDRHARALPRRALRAAAGRRRVRLAPRRRVPHVEPRDDRAAPAGGARGDRGELRRVLAADERRRRPARFAAGAAALRREARGPSGSSSRRSSPRPRSSSASPPARCRSARCRARRTRRSRSP